MNDVWDASLSTMWAIKKYPRLEDFLGEAQRLGFAAIELNHQINSRMLSSVHFNGYRISSIHEPCPADIPVEYLKEHDWLISADDEANRLQGVQAIRRSIDYAGELGVRTVVVHCGNVQNDLSGEMKLRTLYAAGQVDSLEYRERKEEMIRTRASLAGPRLTALKKSLAELLEYASRSGVCLSLENRYHYMDLPNCDEMEMLLGQGDPDLLGFTYDVGHALTLDHLGFYPYEEWLQRFADRIMVVHLHDVIGLQDHHAPGLGEVDFGRVAAYLPPQAIRTCELHPSNSPEAILAGMQLLVETGCIRNG
jgi:sugar phosphate isomerase/epimerase